MTSHEGSRIKTFYMYRGAGNPGFGIDLVIPDAVILLEVLSLSYDFKFLFLNFDSPPHRTISEPVLFVAHDQVRTSTLHHLL